MARRKLCETQYSIKAFVYGKEGTRKSNIAIQFARLKRRDGRPFRVLLIDTEYKSIEGFNEDYLVEHGVKPENILELRTRNLDDMQIVVDRFTSGKYIQQSVEQEVEIVDPKTFKKKKVLKEVFINEPELDADGEPFVADIIILDSLSVINDLYVEGRFEVVTKRTNIKIKKEGLSGDEKDMTLENMGLQLMDYNKLQMKAKKMIRDLQAVTGRGIVYVCRAKDAKKSIETIENGKKKIESIDLGYEIMDATSFKFLPYETNLNIHTQKKNGYIEMTIEKDCTGIHKENEVINHFDITEYQAYINNEKRVNLHQTQKYEENLKRAETFTEESDEVDVKYGIHKQIMDSAKADANVATKVKEFCVKHGITGAQCQKPELISLDMLLQMKEFCLTA